MTKKEWFAIQWVSKARNQWVKAGNTIKGVSLDISLENAQRRVETLVTGPENLIPLKGYIHKIEHEDCFKETAEGEIETGFTLTRSVRDAKPISNEFAVVPQDKRQEVTYKEKIELSNDPVIHALFFTTSLRTGVETRPSNAFIVPIEVLNNPKVGTDLYSLLDKNDETLVIDDNKAVVVMIYNNHLRQAVLNARKNINSNKPEKRSNIAVNLDPYVTKTTGYYSGDNPKKEIRSKEEISKLFKVDDDMGAIDIQPTGVFAEYQNGLEAAIRKIGLEKTKGASPSTP